MDWKNRKTHWYEAVSSAKEVSQNCFVLTLPTAEFSFLTLSDSKVEEVSQSRRIASFFMLSPSKMEEALQNCFVFDVANCRIVSFLTLSSSKVEEVSQSRRIASFFMLSPSKMEEALQNSFVFKLANRKKER